MSSNQRLEVWRGQRKKTSGGLTKEMLTKNKRGKIVSKKKSEQASDQNNLGSWLRETGKKVPKDEMLRKKGAKPGEAKPTAKPKAKSKAKQAPKAAPKVVPKKKAVQKAVAPKVTKAKKPAPTKSKAKPKVVRSKSKAALKSKINPLTKQPYDKRNKQGYVADAKVSLDNVKRTKLRSKRGNVSKADIRAALLAAGKGGGW